MKKNILSLIFAVYLIINALSLTSAVNFNETYNSNTNLVFANQTERSNLGVRLIMNSTGIFNVTSGDFESLIFYNISPTYWKSILGVDVKNVTNASIVNVNANITLQMRTANSYNISDPSLLGLWAGNDEDLIVLHTLSSNMTEIGAWSEYAASTSVGGQYSRVATTTGTPTKFWNGTFTVKTTGKYGVYVSDSKNAIYCNASQFVVYSDNGVNTIYVNQVTGNSFDWQSLGIYNFTAGNSYNVYVSDYCAVASKYVTFDAFMIRKNNLVEVDETGKNNATLSGIAYPRINAGLVGNGYSFPNGSSLTKVSIDNTAILNGTTKFTISAWVYSKAAVGFSGIVLSRQDGAYINGGLSGDSQGDNFACNINNGNRVISNTNISLNKWYFATCTWDKSTGDVKIYVNGVLDNNGSYSAASFSHSTKFLIGQDVSSNYWNGYIDEVRIYNRSLSASEVQDLYNLGSTHISDWSAWSSPTIVQDGVPVNSSTSGKFMQFKANLNTNDASVSPYIISYNLNSSSLSDTISQNVQFVSPAEISGININGRDNIIINVTAEDAILANITIKLYNSTTLLNSTTSATSPYFMNFTGLSDGLYFFNATTCDTINHCNNTETRNVTLIIGYFVVNLSSEFDIVASSDENTSFVDTPQHGSRQAIVKVHAKKVGKISINFTKNQEVAGLVADSSSYNNAGKKLGKAVVHIPPNSADVFDIILLVPVEYGSGLLYVCPNASSLEDVNESCPNKYFTTAVNIAGYYEIPVTGTGAA